MPHEPKVGELPALLPCPFCGVNNPEVADRWKSGFIHYMVFCPVCHASGAWQSTKEEVTTAWNTRAEREARKDEARDEELDVAIDAALQAEQPEES